MNDSELLNDDPKRGRLPYQPSPQRHPTITSPRYYPFIPCIERTVGGSFPNGFRLFCNSQPSIHMRLRENINYIWLRAIRRADRRQLRAIPPINDMWSLLVAHKTTDHKLFAMCNFGILCFVCFFVVVR